MEVEGDVDSYGVITLIEDDKIIVIDSPEDGIIHLAWEARLFSLFCELSAKQTQELARRVSKGMEPSSILEAMGDLLAGEEIVHNLRGEVGDHPGIEMVVSALDQLESALAEKGLRFERPKS